MKKKNPEQASILRQKAEKQLKNKLSKSSSKHSEANNLKIIHELNVHQIELKMQNEELMLAKELADIANRNYEDILNFISVPYYKLSREGKIIELNIIGASMLGKERRKLINNKFSFFVSSDTKEIFNIFLDNVFARKAKESNEVTLSIGGSKLPLNVYIRGHVTENGEYCNITVVDISDTKRAEQTLKDIEQQFSLFMDYLPALVFIKDTESRAIYVNNSIDVAFGASKWIGHKTSEIFDKENAERILADDKKTLLTGYQKIEERFYNLDGKMHYYETQKFIIPRAGQIPLLGGISIDITERKLAEQTLKES